MEREAIGINIQSAFSSIAGWSYKNSRTILVVVLFQIIAVPFILQGLRFETISSDSMIPSEDSIGQAYKENRARFGEGESLIIQLLYEGVSLNAVNPFTDRLAKELSSWRDIQHVEYKPIELINSQESIAMLRASLLNSDSSTLEKFISIFNQEAMVKVLRRTRKKLIGVDDPGLRRLIASDVLNLRELLVPYYDSRMGNISFSSFGEYYDAVDIPSRILFVQPVKPVSETDFCVELLEKIDDFIFELKKSLEEGTHIQHRYSGRYAIAAEGAQILKQDMRRITFLATGLVLFLIWLALKSARAILISFIPIIISLLTVFILARFFFNPLNYMTMGFAAIVIGLGVDVMFHCTGRLFQLIQKTSALDKAVRMTLSDCGPPIVIGITTTSAAFFCLFFSSYRPLRQFGLLTSISLLVTMVVSLILFPSIARTVSIKKDKVKAGIRLQKIPGKIFTFSLFRPLHALGIGAAVFFVSLFFVRHFNFDIDVFESVPKNLDSMVVAQEISELYGSSFALNTQLTLKSPNLDEALSAQRLIDQRLVRLKEEEIIAGFQSPSLFLVYPESREKQRLTLLDLERSILEEKKTFFQQLEALNFQSSSFYERYYQMLIAAAAMEENFLKKEEESLFPTRLSRFFSRTENQVYLQTYIWPRSIQKMDYNTAADSLFEEFQNIELPPDVTLNLTGTYQVLRQISETVRTDFFKISLLSLIAVCVLILIFFRNVLILFMSVLPVIAAILFTFATMVLFGVSFTPARIGIAALLIGIGIDDAVHILVRIRNKSIIDIKYTLMEIGPILVLTTLSTMIGFGALSFSDISVISSLGVLLMVGVIACLLFTILLVPSTYNKFYRKKENKRLM